MRALLWGWAEGTWDEAVYDETRAPGADQRGLETMRPGDDGGVCSKLGCNTVVRRLVELEAVVAGRCPNVMVVAGRCMHTHNTYACART